MNSETMSDFNCEKRLAALNPTYSNLVKDATFVLYHALDQYKKYFPDFTDHTIHHSMQVMNFCNQLIGAQVNMLNADELYVLLMSAYLHDFGMGISEKDFNELSATVVPRSYLTDHPNVSTREVIRSFHQCFSKQLIYRYAAIFEIPSPVHTEAIALVAEAHRKTDLYSETLLPAVLRTSNGTEIHLPYLAALLRLADELDIAADRNPELLENGRDNVFKMMHRSIRHMHVLPDRFVLDVMADDPALYDGVQKEIYKLAENLRICADVVEKRTPFRIYQNTIYFNHIVTSGRHITVLDTDLGTDDACALLLLNILHRKPDYIVASHGNTTLKNACRNGVLLKKYLGLQASIVCGLPAPVNDKIAAEEKNTFHGPDGLAGLADAMADKYNVTPEDTAAVLPFDTLRRELQSADAITYITIGTLTNLSALLEDESVRPRMQGIYVMGGGIKEFNCSHETEFNFSKDPESVRKLLSSGLNITLFPLDVTNRQRLDEKDIAFLEKIGSYPEYIQFLQYNLKSNREFNRIPAAVLHDTLPVLYLSHPDWFTLEDIRIVADEYGHIFPDGSGEAVHICTRVKGDVIMPSMRRAFELARSIFPEK